MKERTLAPAEDEPLFLDEPPDLPKAAGPDTSSFDDLFPSEDDLPSASSSLLAQIDWREMNALDRRASETARQEPTSGQLLRPTLVVAVIVAAVFLGFAVVSLLLR